MLHAAFTYLCIIIHPVLEQNYQKNRYGGSITVEMTIVACGLLVLVGGRQNNMTHIFGISRPRVYLTFPWFLRAVNGATELNIVFPWTDKEWDKVRMEFRKKSYCELFHGCCGAIDVFFSPLPVLL